MLKKFLNLFVLFLVSGCSSVNMNNVKYATELELQKYYGTYYITVTFLPKNSHLMIMGGVGDTLDLSLLNKNSLDQFINDFYEQLVYFPEFIDDYDYKTYINCLGYEITWDVKYANDPIYSNIIEETKLRLEDGVYVIIKKYRVLGELKVQYVSDFEKCTYSNSLELDIRKIKTIDKIAILLDGEE